MIKVKFEDLGRFFDFALNFISEERTSRCTKKFRKHMLSCAVQASSTVLGLVQARAGLAQLSESQARRAEL